MFLVGRGVLEKRRGIGITACIANSCDGSSESITHKYNKP